MTLKVQILQTLVGLTMTWFSEKMLILNIGRHGLMPNLIKKSWTVSTATMYIVYGVQVAKIGQETELEIRKKSC